MKKFHSAWTIRTVQDIPEMPALIPCNEIITKDIITKSPHSANHKPSKPHSDDDKVLSDQIQLVWRIQQILGTEQKKLKLMLKQLQTSNKPIAEQYKGSQLEKAPLSKQIKICSPSSCNTNLEVIIGTVQTVDANYDNKAYLSHSAPCPQKPNPPLKSLPNSCSSSGVMPNCKWKELESSSYFLEICNDMLEDEEIDLKAELNNIDYDYIAKPII